MAIPQTWAEDFSSLLLSSFLTPPPYFPINTPHVSWNTSSSQSPPIVCLHLSVQTDGEIQALRIEAKRENGEGNTGAGLTLI